MNEKNDVLSEENEALNEKNDVLSEENEALNELLNGTIDEILKEAIKEAIKDKKLNGSLTEKQNKILAIIYKYPDNTQIEIAQKTNLSKSTIQRIMEQLKNQGIIERIGSKRNGQWHIK